jgi:hypothetical protein
MSDILPGVPVTLSFTEEGLDSAVFIFRHLDTETETKVQATDGGEGLWYVTRAFIPGDWVYRVNGIVDGAVSVGQDWQHLSVRASGVTDYTAVEA